MPDWSGEIRRRLSAARLPPEREAGIVDEVAQHLEDRYQTLLASGQPAAEAERRAWRELEGDDDLGRLLSAHEPPRRPSLAGLEVAPRGRLLRGLWHDVRYAVRNLRKRSMLSATIIVTLAISLGPTAAVIGMADALFFRPLPVVAGQDRLLHYAFGTPMRDGFIPHEISYANLAEIRDGATTVVGIAGQTSISCGLALDGVAPRLALGTAITANYFDVLGVRVIAGRTFRAEEDSAPGGDPVMVLNEGLARAFFGAPDAAVGRAVLVNSVPFTVIGVTPAAFLGTNASRPSEFWIPGMSYRRANNVQPSRWAYGPNEGPFHDYIVRMAAGASLAQTTAELTARTRALVERELGSHDPFLTIVPILQPGLAAPASLQAVALHAMQLIGAVAGLLVLLGMTNVANLLIFTGLASGHDVAVRKALGASAGRLLQLRLVESILLTLLGALAGVGVAAGLGRLFSDFALPGIGTIEVAIDWRVVLAVACLAVVAGTCAGVAPALLAVRESVTGALGRGIRTGPPRAGRLRHALAAVQVALSLTLLVGALLFLMTLRHLRSVDLGFDPAGVTVVTLNVRGYGYTDAASRRILEAGCRRGSPTAGDSSGGSRVQSSTVQRGLDRRDVPAWPGSEPGDERRKERRFARLLRGGSPADRPRPRFHRGRDIWQRGDGPQASGRHRSVGATAVRIRRGDRTRSPDAGRPGQNSRALCGRDRPRLPLQGHRASARRAAL